MLFKLLKIAKQINLKTLIINFTYFSFQDAIKFPIWVDRRVRFENLKGKIIIHGDVKSGMIMMGKSKIGIFDNHYSRMVLDMHGTIEFFGNASVGQGSKISVGPKGILKIGENFRITAQSTIVSHKQVTFGNNCLLSWNILIMDTDFHSIFDNTNQIINPDKEVVIGNNVWIGCNCLILKGSQIADGSVVAANTMINKRFDQQNTVIGGTPVSVLRQNINWKQ